MPHPPSLQAAGYCLLTCMVWQAALFTEYCHGMHVDSHNGFTHLVWFSHYNHESHKSDSLGRCLFSYRQCLIELSVRGSIICISSAQNARSAISMSRCLPRIYLSNIRRLEHCSRRWCLHQIMVAVVVAVDVIVAVVVVGCGGDGGSGSGGGSTCCCCCCCCCYCCWL